MFTSDMYLFILYVCCCVIGIKNRKSYKGCERYDGLPIHVLWSHLESDQIDKLLVSQSRLFI